MKPMLNDEAIRSRLKRLEIPKGHVLLHAGSQSHQGYFVLQGCLRSYVVDNKGKEHVMQFAPEGWVVGDMKSATRKTPATLNIDALEPSVVLVLNEDVMSKELPRRPEQVEELMTKFRNNIIALNDRIHDLLAASGEQRYLRFIETYPSLVQRLPQKLIASYLGVTPESLSRIRRSIVKKGKKGRG